jgi:glutamate/tyrosine decarboxylase-like PLP-dependent enzyme
MDIKKIIDGPLGKVDPRVAGFVYNRLKRIPLVRRVVDKEFATMLDDMEDEAKPYKGDYETFASLPESGRDRERVLSDIRDFADKESGKWEEGFVSGGVYHGQKDHIDFLNEVYKLNSQVNPLHVDIWPSAMKFEAEIVSMTANMLGAEIANDGVGPGEEICGTVSSGGTESILLAMKTYRDRARVEKGITAPEMVLPVTAHAAFDKAAQFFNIKAVKVPINGDYRADLKAFKKALTRNTVVAVGSAPAFPHGIVDPIEEMSQAAARKGIGFHVDGCLGGFLLPWARELGYDVPPFDFRLPGVTSMSADTHKYGYAAKGTSVVLYRGRALRHYQFFTATDWPGGIYFSPTLSGSRPGALSAACWAAMVNIGASGYRDAAKRILATASQIKTAIRDMEEIEILGDPLWVIAFASKREDIDIYRVMAHMGDKGWSLNGLHKPSCVHLCVTLPHTAEGVAERFISDLREGIAAVKADPGEAEGIAPVYGMAATMPVRGMVGEMLRRYLDILYKV